MDKIKKWEEISQLHISQIYGGVLGKIIGVRLGNPVEFRYSSQEMQKYFPYIDGYLDKNRTIYVDDDTNGFVFFAKIFEKIQNLNELTPELVAQMILNYACENRGFFWWDKYGTESMYVHNLLNGNPARDSGIFPNQPYASDCVGGQIFYDAIGLIFGGNPRMAAYCAGIVSDVMHHGEGAYGAEFICACISLAFYESDTMIIVKKALEYIPSDSNYAKMVHDIIRIYEKHPYDWIACQHIIDERYDSHFIWDYSAHIIMALLYGKGDFSYSMNICMKSAGDTDCNCGNLGCILGVLNGVEGISYKRWIQPMNDVLYCSSSIPYENEVSITQFTAYLIQLFGKWNDYIVPDYIKKSAQFGSYGFSFLYSYQNIETVLWREGYNDGTSVNRYNSLWISQGEVETPSGTPYALKFWANEVKSGDCLRIYRWFHHGNFETMEYENIKYEPTFCTKLFSGQTIQVNIMTYDNSCKAEVCLVAYSSETGNEIRSTYQLLEENKWLKLELTIPYSEYHYDCINVEIIAHENSVFKNGFDGIAIYLDDLAIKNTPNYCIKYTEQTPPLIWNGNHYPIVQNFTVCYGEAYYGFFEQKDVIKRFVDKRYDYCRFCSGYLEIDKEKLNGNIHSEQSVAQNKKLAMALTGPYIHSGVISCTMSIIPKGDKLENYIQDKNQIGAFMVFGVKGIVEHYAVGFYQNKVAILKNGTIPGQYQELCSKQYNYSLEKQYYFKVKIVEKEIVFSVEEIEDKMIYKNKVNIHCQVDEDVYGCIGFVGIGNGITIYQYGIDGE